MSPYSCFFIFFSIQDPSSASAREAVILPFMSFLLCFSNNLILKLIFTKQDTGDGIGNGGGGGVARRRLFGDRVDVFPFPWLFSPVKWAFSTRPRVQVGRGQAAASRQQTPCTRGSEAAKLLLSLVK